MNIFRRNTQSVATDPSWMWEQFRLGYDYFTAGEQPNVCANAEQRRGWWSALKASADTDTDIYLRGGNR